MYEALISQDGFEQGSAFYFRQGSDNKYLDWGGGEASHRRLDERPLLLYVKAAMDERS